MDTKKDMAKKLYLKGAAIQKCFLTTSKAEVEKWEFDEAGIWEDRLPLFSVNHIA